MPCFRDESRVIAQQYFKENYRSSRLQQTILEKMRKFKLYKANFAGTSFSPKKNFAFLSIFKRKDGWLFFKTNLPINRYSEIEKRWRTIFLKYFDFSTILLQTLTGHRFSFQHIKLKHVDWKMSFFPKMFIERFKQNPNADFLKYKDFNSKILFWDANRSNFSFLFMKGNNLLDGKYFLEILHSQRSICSKSRLCQSF